MAGLGTPDAARRRPLAARGWRIQRHRGDPLKLGGDVVIARDGRNSYLYRSPDPDARPPIEDLVPALR